MKLTKIIDKRRTCTSKSGKTYHPSYYVLSLDKLNDGISYNALINLVDGADRKILDLVCDVRIKENQSEND